MLGLVIQRESATPPARLALHVHHQQRLSVCDCLLFIIDIFFCDDLEPLHWCLHCPLGTHQSQHPPHVKGEYLYATYLPLPTTLFTPHSGAWSRRGVSILNPISPVILQLSRQ